jgi:hypothetical protein
VIRVCAADSTPWRFLFALLRRLPRNEFPRLRSLASKLARYDGAHLLDKGLDITLDGLESFFRTTAAATGD